MKLPITRRMQLAAVRKDAGTLTAVESAGGQRTFTFRASDGDFDRYQDRLSVKGWKLDGYNANGVVLFNHDDGAAAAYTGAEPPLPIGKGRVYVEGDALMIDVAFDQNDPFAKRVESKVANGYLNAVSVRYLMLPGQYRQNERGGFDCDAQELLEVSIVTIPGNARAVRAKALDGDSGELVEVIANRVVELLDKRDADKAKPDDEEPPEQSEPPAEEPGDAAPGNESKPETVEPPPADEPKAGDDEDDKAKGFNAAEAAKGFVSAFKDYFKGEQKR